MHTWAASLANAANLANLKFTTIFQGFYYEGTRRYQVLFIGVGSSHGSLCAKYWVIRVCKISIVPDQTHFSV
jgi:hypothetical protein